MPILKSLGVGDPKVPRAGTLPLRSSRNPFEDTPTLEEEDGELGTLPNGTSCRRRATLEKLAGLAPFRLGWTSGRRAGSPGDGQVRSFLGRVLAPGIRRSSADFGLLNRLQGFRTHGDEEPAGEAARRLAFLRLGRGPKPRRASLAERLVPAGEAAPEPPPKVPEPPKIKEPLSVLEILGLIQRRELARADEHILELEAEAPAAEAEAGAGRRARDVALLYEALQRELWALVREALASPGPGTGAVAQLGLDVAAVRGRLAPAYPAGLRAGAVYLRGYHEALAEWLGAAARRRLPLADRYALLHWHNQVYPREILGLVDVVALENGELGPLLSAGTLRGLEDECVTDVKAQTRAALLRVLQEDEEQWGSMDYRPSNLAQDVCELLEEHTERAPHISQEFVERMAYCCLGGLAEFLQSFQQRVERFHENPGVRELPSDTYISRTISMVNCGPPLRSLAERLARVGPPESEPAREASAIALDRVTRLCHRVLAELLFQELQPHFNKLMRRKWLSSSEALDGIVGTLGAQALALRRMQDEPYQVLVAELHRRALVEYVRPLLRGRLRCRSARTRSRVAGRLREDAAQLQRLFRRLESQAYWLDQVVPHLAEILQLEDTPSIQVEVGVLVRDYPDIRRKHVAALLDIRGLRNTAARQEILAVARDLELSEGGALSPSRDRAFFADIPVPRTSFCLGLPLFLGRLPVSRLARPNLACLPLRPRPPSPVRARARADR
ncbi:exocyst complex component 3-like protein 2 [Grammomys surdaster]|uniref:exocyst complex component 3-like protein 2 n=1 Tax=Grammomys surdaster TaxID=491861 RepID=UPI0010A08C52|nr:exocyst complex component 3-like protein 2 [Grammomys surdaster]